MLFRPGLFPVLRCLFLALAWISAPALPSEAAMEVIAEKVVEGELASGMKVLLLPRHKVPTVSLFMRFTVGSVEEEQGRTGLAHLLEHMMFKGTGTLGTRDYAREKPLREEIEKAADALDRERLRGEESGGEREERLRERLRSLQKEARRHVIKDEIDSLYTASGARGLNASTGADLTTYKVSLPANRLELWARIESERLRDPVMREFYSERDVVIEERLQSFETDPSRKLMALLLSTAFTSHPYRRPVIGWAGDVDFLRAAEAEEFFRTWYSPGNAVLAAVGDFDAGEMMSLLEKYFGGLPRRQVPLRRHSAEPPQEGERRAVLRMDAEPQVILAFHKPTLPERDDYVFDLVDGLLSLGRTSRLHRRLVEEDELALWVSTSNGIPGARFPNLFIVRAAPRHPHTAQDVEEAVYEELRRLASSPPGEEELRKVRNQMRAGLLRGLRSNEGLASLLSYFEAVAGDWRYAATHLEILGQVTPGELTEAAQKYFVPENMTVVVLETEGPAEGP